MTTITEDDTGNSGDLISAIVTTDITDVDSGASEGIAITSLTSSNGTWEYNTGSGWTAVGAVSNSSALLLRDADSLRFVPDGQNADTAAVTYRAWDQTSGAAGTKVDASTNGGTTAFSTATDTAAITVTAINDAPTITSDGGGGTANINMVEGNTAVTTVTSTDVDVPADMLSYSLVGGTDQGVFSIDANTGALTFNSAPAFASPADADMDNVYEVQVQVSDGNGGADTQTINVTVTDTNTAPIITSNGGGAIASVIVAEDSTTAVTSVVATDADLPGDSLTFSIIGGADAGRFNINSSTGSLTFNTIPNFENPIDTNADNVYHVQVQVSDGNGGIDSQTLTVTVTNVIEPLPPPPEPVTPPPEPEPEDEQVTDDSPSDSINEKNESPRSESQVTVEAPAGLSDKSNTRSQEGPEVTPALQLDTVNHLGKAVQHLGSNPFDAPQEFISASLMSPSLDIPTHEFPETMSRRLDMLADALEQAWAKESSDDRLLTNVAKGSGLTLSAGYVAWLLRGGSILTSLLATLPISTYFDPLPVLSVGFKKPKNLAQEAQAEKDQEDAEFEGLRDLFEESDETSQHTAPTKEKA